MSEQETIDEILSQNPITVEPQSRGEKILRNIVNGEGTEGLDFPQNRGEAYLYRIAKGGSGGDSIPKITITLDQFIADKEVQLTDEQYTILTTNTFVTIDASTVGMGKFGVMCGVDWNGGNYAIANVGLWDSERIYNGRIYVLPIENDKVMKILSADFPVG